MATLRIKQVRSGFGRTQPQRDTLRAIGLRRIGYVVEKPDSPSLRGMLKTVGHLVSFEEVAETPKKTTPRSSRAKSQGSKASDKKAASGESGRSKQSSQRSTRGGNASSKPASKGSTGVRKKKTEA